MACSTTEHIVNITDMGETQPLAPANPASQLSKEAYRQRVRELNDDLRSNGRGGMIVMTNCIALLDRPAITKVFEAVAAFDDFGEANDPWGEHDCAVLNAIGLLVMFKIDYFDKSRTYHSPNPADPKVTTRIMTVMLAEEY